MIEKSQQKEPNQLHLKRSDNERSSNDERYKDIYDNLDIETPEPIEGNWTEEVTEIPAGDVFFEELREYVNLPIIKDGLDDKERRTWRKWATDKGLNLDIYLSNKLKLNKLNKLHQSVDFLCPKEQFRDGSIPSEIIEDLSPIKELIEAVMIREPGEYQQLSVQEIVKDVLEIALNDYAEKLTAILEPLGIRLSINDLEQIISKLELNPEDIAGNLSDDKVSSDVTEAILAFLKEQNKDLDRRKLRPLFTGIIGLKMSGERLYNTPQFSLNKKIALAKKLEELLGNFLRKYTK